MLSNRDITRSGFSLCDSVSNLIFDGVWRWPIDWLSRFPFMAQLHVPLLLDDMEDVILWRDRNGVLWPFLVACAWDTIRSRADIVNWYNVVWFPQCVLYHAIHLWCSFSSHMWSKVHVLFEMDVISPRLSDVIILAISKGKTVVGILARIMVAATSYYIWLERNERLFKKKILSPGQLFYLWCG
uniref:Reverse transcriptase domain, reverse transcriptase zinc-binding domain protein n=1 Tax=Tanacetum cinerariifolium TaxID=118510 RepID=A0A6L2MAR7_TANCI|nr:hypothetical protein [Tanacetum cinerariifolium]